MDVTYSLTEAEPARRALAENPLDAEAAARLAGVLEQAPPGDAELDALRDVCRVLNGPCEREDRSDVAPPSRLDRDLHERLVIHPREQQQRHHQLASVLGRVLHMLEGDDIARTVARVTERAAEADYPRLCREAALCADALEVELPPIHIARGEERFCEPLIDRSLFLCIHREWGRDGDAADSGAVLVRELRFLLARSLHHVRSGHTALLQVTPERLESLVLEQLPYLVRAPLKLATRAVGWTRANEAMRKFGDWLPEKSRSQKVAQTMGDILPEKDQETVLPEFVHEWVRCWIQGVEFSADRAGLVVSESLAASCGAILCPRTAGADECRHWEREGLRAVLANGLAGRARTERLRELVRFALSEEYLEHVRSRS